MFKYKIFFLLSFLTQISLPFNKKKGGYLYKLYSLYNLYTLYRNLTRLGVRVAGAFHGYHSEFHGYHSEFHGYHSEFHGYHSEFHGYHSEKKGGVTIPDLETPKIIIIN